MPEMTLNIDTSGSGSGGMRLPYNKRGECSVCGKPAYDGRATKCDEHRTGKPKPTRAPGRASSDPITFVTPDGQTSTPKAPEQPPAQPLSPKALKAEQVKAAILTDVNPQLVKGFALVCRPVPEHNFYQLDGGKLLVTDPLGRTPMFADWEADLIGKCAAELESQPMVQLAGKAAGPVVPYLYMLGGIAVVAWHGYNCMMTRDKVLAQWQRMQAENTANQARPMPQPSPPGETPPAPVPNQSEPEVVTLYDEAIDAEIVAMIPPSTNGKAPVPEPGEFSDVHTA